MTDPTPEQIEAAARTLDPDAFELSPVEWEREYGCAPEWSGQSRRLRREAAKHHAQVALVAAAGAAPQMRECQCYGADGVTDQKCPACAAPVQVDEAKLAEVIWAEQESRVLNGYVIHTRATAATTAAAVADFLRGGGR